MSQPEWWVKFTGLVDRYIQQDQERIEALNRYLEHTGFTEFENMSSLPLPNQPRIPEIIHDISEWQQAHEAAEKFRAMASALQTIYTVKNRAVQDTGVEMLYAMPESGKGILFRYVDRGIRIGWLNGKPDVEIKLWEEVEPEHAA